MKWSEILPKKTLKLGEMLAESAQEERDNGKVVYPPQNKIFRALELTPPDKVKVCLIGQDPYHNGAADGLAFSVSTRHNLQPSLANIFNELVSDLNVQRPISGNLSKWAQRGVLLLNTSLTVYEHRANSHSWWGWDKFVKSILKTVHEFDSPIVYLLWGMSAQALMKDLINSPMTYPNEDKHVVMESMKKKAYVLSSHPSPLSVNKMCQGSPAFKGSKPFSTTNQLLIDMGGEPVDWTLR